MSEVNEINGSDSAASAAGEFDVTLMDTEQFESALNQALKDEDGPIDTRKLQELISKIDIITQHNRNKLDKTHSKVTDQCIKLSVKEVVKTYRGHRVFVLQILGAGVTTGAAFIGFVPQGVSLLQKANFFTIYDATNPEHVGIVTRTIEGVSKVFDTGANIFRQEDEAHKTEHEADRSIGMSNKQKIDEASSQSGQKTQTSEQKAADRLRTDHELILALLRS